MLVLAIVVLSLELFTFGLVLTVSDYLTLNPFKYL